MDFNGFKQYKKQLSAFGALTLLGAINYLALTPLKFMASGLGIILFYHFHRKFKEDFNMPMLFKRDSPSKWGAYFGGLTGGVSGLYGATRVSELTFLEFGAELSMITVYVALVSLLMTGSILEDVKRGNIEVN